MREVYSITIYEGITQQNPIVDTGQGRQEGAGLGCGSSWARAQHLQGGSEFNVEQRTKDKEGARSTFRKGQFTTALAQTDL